MPDTITAPLAIPTQRQPAPPPPVPAGVESPITIYGFRFDPEHEPIGARLAAETAGGTSGN